MSEFQHGSALELTFKALESDLLQGDGPQISTTRNYNFAIVPYEPDEEFALRRHVSALSDKLRDAGWIVATIALNTLLLERLRGLGQDTVNALIAREQRLFGRSPSRALNRRANAMLPFAWTSTTAS